MSQGPVQAPEVCRSVISALHLYPVHFTSLTVYTHFHSAHHCNLCLEEFRASALATSGMGKKGLTLTEGAGMGRWTNPGAKHC